MPKDVLPTTVRPLHVIGMELLGHLRKLPESHMGYWAGIPYSRPLIYLQDTNDVYGADSADSIIRYALGNLSSWRGEDAKRIRAELKAHLAGVKPESK